MEKSAQTNNMESNPIYSHYVQSNEQHTNKVSVEDENRTNSLGNYTPMDENNTTRILDSRDKTCSTHQKVINSTENSNSNFENRNTFSNKKYRNNHPNVKQNTDSKSRKSNHFLANNKSKIKPPWKQMRPTAMETGPPSSSYITILHRTTVISTINIESFSTNYMYFLDILKRSDIVCVQEHWLYF